MRSSQLSLLENARAPEEEEDLSTTLAEHQIYDSIANEPMKDSPKERALQAVARSLVYEYGFDPTQFERDVTVTYEITDSHGRTKRTRRKVDLVVYPEGKPKELKHIMRVAVVQPPISKAQDRKKDVELLEEVSEALPACNYGLWTNRTDLDLCQKASSGGCIQPEYMELCDLRGEDFVWASVFTQKAVKMRFRPRMTLQGGETGRAV